LISEDWVGDREVKIIILSIRLGHQKRSLQYASVEANVREGKCDLYTVARIIS